MKVLLVRPTAAKYPGDDAINRDYADRALSDCMAQGDNVELKDAANIYSATAEDIEATRQAVLWCDVVRVYTDHGKDPAMINIERIAERIKARVQVVRIGA